MSEDNKVLNKLNELANVYLKNLDLSEIKPATFHGDESVTLIPEGTDGAFNLNPVTAGHIKNIETGAKNNQGAICRSCIGYSFASKLETHPELFNFQFSLAINSMLGSLTRYLGDLSMRKVTAFRPGQGDIVFRDLENSAAYEFRIYVEKKTF
ncbi:MAG TPA: hypothetical protein VKR58_14455 [Aquella sp.]|nr:hypothetical protein [Aquella sp.]